MHKKTVYRILDAELQTNAVRTECQSRTLPAPFWRNDVPAALALKDAATGLQGCWPSTRQRLYCTAREHRSSSCGESGEGGGFLHLSHVVYHQAMRYLLHRL